MNLLFLKKFYFFKSNLFHISCVTYNQINDVKYYILIKNIKILIKY